MCSQTPRPQRTEPGTLKLVSGGQTGADRAALDVALRLGLPCGGWVPCGRRAEDGPIPAHYPGLVECETPDYAERTRRNVRDADATLVLSHGAPCGGTALTVELARASDRPLLHLDLRALDGSAARRRLRAWLREQAPAVLNVAGPRASEDAAIYAATRELLEAVLATPARR